MTDFERNSKLNDLIDELAVSEHYWNDKIYIQHGKILSDIYSEGNYITKNSQVFSILSKYFESNRSQLEGLNFNLEQLTKYITLEKFGEITFNGFQALHDQINLEIGRYHLYEKKLKVQSGAQGSVDTNELRLKIKKLENDIEISNAVTADAKKAMIEVDSKLERNSISSITALTIFSAVILTFSGGFNLVTGVLSEISSVSALKLTLISSLLGFILYNTIFMLLYVVAKMTGKSISGYCKYFRRSSDDDDTLQNCENGYCLRNNTGDNLMCKVIRKYTLTLTINLIFVLIMYYSFTVWLFNECSYLKSTDFPIEVPIIVYLVPILIALSVILSKVSGLSNKIQLKRQYNEYKLQIIYNSLNFGQTSCPFKDTNYCTCYDDFENFNQCRVNNDFEVKIKHLNKSVTDYKSLDIEIDKFLKIEFEKHLSKNPSFQNISLIKNKENLNTIKRLLIILIDRNKT